MNTRIYVESMSRERLPEHLHGMWRRSAVYRAWYRVGKNWWRPVMCLDDPILGSVRLFTGERNAENAAYEAWKRHQMICTHVQMDLPFDASYYVAQVR